MGPEETSEPTLCQVRARPREQLSESQKERSRQKPGHDGNMISDFQLSELGEHKFLSLKLLILYYCVRKPKLTNAVWVWKMVFATFLLKKIIPVYLFTIDGLVF